MRSTLHRMVCLFVLILPAGGLFAQKAIISTAAGTGAPGFSGDSGPATAAMLNGPADMTADAAGNLYIADRDNHRIRKVAAGSGVITTVAGTGNAGPGGDSGPATSAALNHPSGVAVDAGGNLYIADFQNNRIRKVNAATGAISTSDVLQFYPQETLPGASDPFWKKIENLAGIRFYKDGYALPVSLSGPVGVVVDSEGNLFVTEQTGHRIRKIAAETGFVTTIAGTGTAGFSGDGGPAAAAQIHSPAHLALDSAGNVYFADSLNHRIRKVTVATGVISTVAGSGAGGSAGGFRGDGGLATSAQLNNPGGVAVDSAGNLVIADTLNQRIRRVTANTGVISTIAGGGDNGDGCAAATASLDSPESVRMNPSGTVIYIADDSDQRIRLVTFAAGTPPPGLTSIAPPSGLAGTTITVALTGAGFLTCGAETTVSISGAGVSVTNAKAASDTSITATLAIAADAALGVRNVTVVTESGTSAAIPFTVIASPPPPPALSAITPASGVRGSTASLTLAGANFGLSPGSTNVQVAGKGITIGEVRVASANSLTATFTIAADANLGDYNVTVVTAGGSSNAVPFAALPQGPTFVYGFPPMLNPTGQSPIQVSLTGSSPEPVTGTLTLTFVPNASNAIDDPNVTFLNSQTSTRTAALTFPANTTSAQLSLPSGVLQAGTEAGTIQLTMTDVRVGGMEVLPEGSAFDVEVPRLVPTITNVRIFNRSSGGFDVEVTGYSTSREITAATFDFAEASGAHLLTVQLQPDVVSTFTTYYQSETSSAAGGAFVYVQPFLAQQGNANAVASVTVSLTNVQGTSQPKTAR